MFVNTTSHNIIILTKNNEKIHLHPDPNHQIHCHYVEGRDLPLRSDVTIKEFGHWKISDTFNKFKDYPAGTIILTSHLIGLRFKEMLNNEYQTDLNGFKMEHFENDKVYIGSYNHDTNELLIYF